MADQPQKAARARRPLFDLNVAQEEFEEEDPEEVLEEVVEEEVLVEEEEEEPEEVIMEEAAEEVGDQEVEMARGEEDEEAEWEGSRRRRDREVFVGGLPRDAAEHDVARALADAGEVEEVRLVRDPAEPRFNKGFAFVRFAAAWQARWAANDLCTVMMKGKACGICKNNENGTLHLRNICFDWTKDDLSEELKPFELENLEDINLIEHTDRKGKNRGYAFLDFSTHIDALAAFLKLQKNPLYLGTDIRAHISFSNTISQDDKVMEKVRSVFLDGLPSHWDEDKVREIFGKFGEIDNIQLARNMFTAKRKDFGFISFTTRQSALDCINVVNKDRVAEGSGKVRIKASLQRPKPTFRKPSWHGSSQMLGVRSGFVGKSYNDRGPHMNKFRQFSPQRHGYSNNLSHTKYHRQSISRLPSMAADVVERPFLAREYKGYHRRDSAVSEPSHQYGRTHQGTRIREAYVEFRYDNKYPKRRQAVYEASMQRDVYSRSKYDHSNLERAHRDSCPECNPSNHNTGSYQNGMYPSSGKAVRRYHYQNGEEYSSTSRHEKANYKTDHELTSSTSQVISQCEGPCCDADCQLMTASAVGCDCEQCYIEQGSAPSSSQDEVARTQLNPEASLHRRTAKPFHKQRRFVPDEHSAYEAEYSAREHRGRYLTARDGLRAHHRKYHRQGR